MCYEVDEGMWQTVNIHDYITCDLMPGMGWKRITSQRLNWIKSIIEKQQLDVVTFQMDEAPIYREYVPLDNNHSWYEYIDHIFSSVNI